jgi:hypothetical protein
VQALKIVVTGVTTPQKMGLLFRGDIQERVAQGHPLKAVSL